MRPKIRQDLHKTKPADIVKASDGAAGLRLGSLDRDSFIPLYFQIQEKLLEMIRSGQLHVGDPLPGAGEISRTCGVSRVTARQALQSLKDQGFASRSRSGGIFVLPPKVDKNIAHLSGFTAEMNALGMKTESRVLHAETIAASAELGHLLAVKTGSFVFRLHRLRLANGVPIAIEETWLSLDLFPGLERVDFASFSLYQTLRERYKMRVSMAEETLEARPADQQEARLLKIAPRSSLLAISRTLWSAEGKPIELARSLYRGDRYRATIRVATTALG